MTSPASQAAEIFNRVMRDHSIALTTSALDFTIGEKSITPALNDRGRLLADKLFDLVFPRAPSGVYYNYMTFGAFQAVISTSPPKLRFFSTRKRSSIGEFIPLAVTCEVVD